MKRFYWSEMGNRRSPFTRDIKVIIGYQVGGEHKTNSHKPTKIRILFVQLTKQNDFLYWNIVAMSYSLLARRYWSPLNLSPHSPSLSQYSWRSLLYFCSRNSISAPQPRNKNVMSAHVYISQKMLSTRCGVIHNVNYLKNTSIWQGFSKTIIVFLKTGAYP